MAPKIYTKTGDKGTTSLFGGTKVPKSHLRIEAYGTIDELNSFIGLLGDQLASATAGSVPPVVHAPADLAGTRDTLHEVQDRLLTIGATLATEKEPSYKMPELTAGDITALERSIDAMDALLPPLRSFVLPGGHLAVSTAHVARCVCRRAERCCVRMQEEQMPVNPLVLQYLNRLSDYLFTVARFAAHLLRVQETPWNPKR